MNVRVPVPQPGRRSSSSGRASVTTVSGTPVLQSSRWSMKSSRPASAQWRSSNRRTTGPGRGDPLEERAPRAEQLLAGGTAAAFEPEQDEERVLDPAALGLVGDPARDPGRDRGPGRRLIVALDQTDPAADHLAERPERDALAVGR